MVTASAQPPVSTVAFRRAGGSLLLQLRSSRSIRGVAVIAILSLLALIVLLASPMSDDVRLVAGVIGALVVLAAGGAFLCYRALSFARRMAAENVEIKQKLGQVAMSFATLERDFKAVTGHKSATPGSLAQHIERQVTTGLSELQQRIAGLANLQAELGSLRMAHGQVQASVQSLSAQGVIAAAEIGALKEWNAATLKERAGARESIAARLDQFEKRQFADAARFADAVESVSDRLSGLAARVDGESSLASNLRLRLAAACEALGTLDAFAREGLAQSSIELAALKEAASHGAERTALVEGVVNDTRLSLSRAIEAARSDTREVRAEADLIRKSVSRLETQAVLEADRLSALAGRLDSVDEAIGGLPQLAGRVAALNDLTRQMAGHTTTANESFRQELNAEVEHRLALTSKVAMLEDDRAADHAALAAMDARIIDIETHTPLLAERLAWTDDFVKALYCDVQIAQESKRTITADLANLANQITSVNEGFVLLANSHAELRFIIGGLQQSFDGDHQLLAEIGPQLAEIATLSQQFVTETAAVLSGIEGRLVRSETQLTAGLSDLFARVDGIDAEIKGSAARLDESVARTTERLGGLDDKLEAKAQARALDDLGLRVAELAELSKRAAEQAGRELSTVTSHVAAIVAESASLRERISALGAEITIKADSDDLAGFERQIAAVEAQVRGIDAGLGDVRAHLEDLREGVRTAHSAARDEAEAVAVKLSGTIDKSRATLAGELAAIAARVGQLDSDLSQRVSECSATINLRVEEASRDSESAKRAILARVAEAEQGLSTVAAVQRGLVDVVDKVQLETREHAELRTATDSHIQSVSGKLAIVERGLADLAKSAGKIKGLEDAAKVEREKIAEISARLNEAKQRIETTERTSMFDNASWYQRFNRRLQQQHIQVLEKEWTRKLSVQGSKATFGYMAARVSEIERELDGRLATTVEDVILRTLVAQATRGASVSVLEIGTLFGIGAAVMFDTLKNHFDDVHFTLLDPLEGYYAGGRPDILTGQPVTEKVVRRNMARAGMRDDQLRLITRLSTEEEAIAEASERLYDVLIIDADHSYAGVKTDFENFGRMVKLGGYVIFDDYGSEDWPDVKAYVDAEIPSADFLAHVGNAWRSSVYRVVKPPAGPRRARPRSE